MRRAQGSEIFIVFDDEHLLARESHELILMQFGRKFVTEAIAEVPRSSRGDLFANGMFFVLKQAARVDQR